MAAARCRPEDARCTLALGQGPCRPRRQRTRRSAGARWRGDGAVEADAAGLITSVITRLTSVITRSKAGDPVFRSIRDLRRGRGVLDRPVRPGDDSWDCGGRGPLNSQLRQQRVAAGDLDLAGRRLEIELLD